MLKILVNREVLVKAKRHVKATISSTKRPYMQFSVSLSEDGQMKGKILAYGDFYYEKEFEVESVGAQGEISVTFSTDFLDAIDVISPAGDEIGIDFNDSNATLSCGKGRVVVSYVSEHTVQSAAPMLELGVIKVNVNAMKLGINKVRHTIEAASVASAWYHCLGLVPNVKGEKSIQFIGFSVACLATSDVQVKDIVIEGEMSALALPPRGFSTVANCLESEECEIHIKARKSENITASAVPYAIEVIEDDCRYVIQLFPQPYAGQISDVVPSYVPGAEFKAFMDRKELINAVKVASFSSDSMKKGIALSLVNDGAFRVSSIDGVNYGDVACRMTGTFDKTILNPMFLLKLLTTYTGDKIALFTNSKTGMGSRNPDAFVVSGGEEGDSFILAIHSDAEAEGHSKSAQAANKADEEEKEREKKLTSE